MKYIFLFIFLFYLFILFIFFIIIFRYAIAYLRTGSYAPAVFKDDDETDPTNYRPISLLSNYNRIFEKIMFNRLKAFIDKNEILYRSQYGFRDKHSTQHAILDIVNSIQKNMDNKLFPCGIFIDLKKAFDTVDHSILLNKFNHYGIRGIVNDWFSSYLFKRTQTTEINSFISASAAYTPVFTVL